MSASEDTVEIFSNNTDAEGSLSLSLNIKGLLLQMQLNDANSPIFGQRLHRNSRGDSSEDRTCMSLEIESSPGISSSEWTATTILYNYAVCVRTAAAES
jgi:hypothetical protein